MEGEKMKKGFSLLTFALLLVFGLGTGSVSAEDLESSNLSIEKAFENLKEEYPDAQLIDYKPKDDENFTTFDAADPVTEVDIISVYSDASGEQDTSGLLSTPEPVGGYTEIYTFILGDGNHYEYMDGTFIPTDSEEYESANTGVDLNGDSIIDGFIYGLAFNSDEVIPNGAKFEHRAISYNAPWNTMSDFLNITHE